MDHPPGERSRAGAGLALWEAAGRAERLIEPHPRPAPRAADPAESPAAAPRTELVVLASSSSGNSSALIHGRGKRRRVTLIDAGLSPARTRKSLVALGLDLDQIDDVILTHLDTDHCHAGWAKALPRHARFRILKSHRGRAQRSGLLTRRTYVFDHEPFDIGHGAVFRAMTLDHDDLGVAVFRVDFATANDEPPVSLGYATDLGRATTGLVDHLRGVDVLAIESNYCPRRQVASDRPAFLKDRIMGGAGHLSNEECRSAVNAIGPRRHVVLLHLSKQCNTPDLASRYHEGSPYDLTVADPDRPTDRILLCAGESAPR